MSKKVMCCKCDKSVTKYNWFGLNFAQPQFTFKKDNNISKFCLCHKCSREMSKWLEASRKDYVRYQFQ